MYKKSLDCFKNKLKKGGYLCFKCQDMTDGKFYCTHNFIINYAKEIGFELKDIIIKRSKTKLQRDAKQQNCVAKVHSYWIILKNKKKEDKNQKYKEVIDKAKKRIEKGIYIIPKDTNEILDILKEVE